jgi:hypothetical protein
VATPRKASNSRDAENTVLLELNPAGQVDILGHGHPPLLWVGVAREFTPAEAEQLLALRNEHGTPVCRRAGGPS